jgi:hypothetical protein
MEGGLQALPPHLVVARGSALREASFKVAKWKSDGTSRVGQAGGQADAGSDRRGGPQGRAHGDGTADGMGDAPSLVDELSEL